MFPTTHTRRHFLSAASLSAAGFAAASLQARLSAAETAIAGKGRINHSACKWCYPKIGLEELCQAGKEMGLTSIDLLQPADFPTLKKHGLVCAMVSNPTVKGPDGKALGGIERAWNRKEHHELLVQAYEPQMAAVADAGLKNLICFSGNRAGINDEQGLKNCAVGLKKLMPVAEKHGVNIVMELLNSKVDHKDYQCDHTAWGAELCKAVESERFKLLYDIYHMQIMEGDVIRTIQKFHPYIAHYHTGGVPGRNEIDQTQELNYKPIMEAILKTGFKGHVAQEFIPKRPDPIASLKQGVDICDV